MIGALFVAALAACAFFLRPRATLAAGLVFLLFQDLIVAVLGGRATALGGVAQALDEALLVVLAVSAVLRGRLAGRAIRIGPWTGWYLLFVLAAAASTAIAGAGWSRFAVGLLLLSKAPLFCLAVEQVDWPSRTLPRVLLVVVGVAVLMALAAPLDLAAPLSFRRLLGFSTDIDRRSGIPSVVSLAGHPGGYAWMTISGALIAAAVAFVRGSRGWAVLSVALVAASSLSMRRKPVLGLIAALVIASPLLLRDGSRRRLAVGVAAVLAVLLPMLLLLAPVLASGVAGYLGEGAALVQARTALYAGAYLLAREALPFGVGLGRYGSLGSITDYSDIYYRFGFDAIDGMSPANPSFIQDTFWPQILGETGVIGVIAFAGMLAAMLRCAWRAARTTDTAIRVTAIAAVLLMIETFLESVAAPSYTTSSQACLALGIASIVGVAARAAAGTKETA